MPGLCSDGVVCQAKTQPSRGKGRRHRQSEVDGARRQVQPREAHLVVLHVLEHLDAHDAVIGGGSAEVNHVGGQHLRSVHFSSNRPSITYGPHLSTAQAAALNSARDPVRGGYTHGLTTWASSP